MTAQTRVVTNTEEFRQACADGLDPRTDIEIGLPAALQEELVTVREAAFAEGRREGERSVLMEAALAERGRIISLHAITPKGFEAHLEQAIDAGTEPGAYALLILELQAAAMARKH